MAEVTRRGVIGGGVAVLGVAMLGFDAVIGGAAAAAPSRSDYASSIGEIFEAFDRRGTTRLRLTDADDVTPSGASRRSQSFVLLFEPLDGARLDDGIYGVRGKGAPTHDLFLSGIGDRATVQAVVNGKA